MRTALGFELEARTVGKVSRRAAQKTGSKVFMTTADILTLRGDGIWWCISKGDPEKGRDKKHLTYEKVCVACKNSAKINERLWQSHGKRCNGIVNVLRRCSCETRVKMTRIFIRIKTYEIKVDRIQCRNCRQMVEGALSMFKLQDCGSVRGSLVLKDLM